MEIVVEQMASMFVCVMSTTRRQKIHAMVLNDLLKAAKPLEHGNSGKTNGIDVDVCHDNNEKTKNSCNGLETTMDLNDLLKAAKLLEHGNSGKTNGIDVDVRHDNNEKTKNSCNGLETTMDLNDLLKAAKPPEDGNSGKTIVIIDVDVPHDNNEMTKKGVPLMNVVIQTRFLNNNFVLMRLLPGSSL